MAQHDVVAPPSGDFGRRFPTEIEHGSSSGTDRDSEFPFLIGRSDEDVGSPRLAGAPSSETPLYKISSPRVAVRPWCMVCALDIEFPAGSREGSGWLAGSEIVMTAGHNVFSSALGGWARRVVVSPGQDGNELPNGRYIAVGVLSVRGWVNDADPSYDYGMIRLPEQVGARTGYFSYGALPDSDLVRRRLNIAGYPLYPGAGEYLHYHGNVIRHVTPDHIFYEVKMQPGESGSPVWVQDDPASDPVVVAIHAGGSSRLDPSLGFGAPSGTRITPKVMKTIRGWVSGA